MIGKDLKSSAFKALGVLSVGVGLFTPAFASLGPFEHGAGIQSQAFGGVVYGAAFETTTIGMNPANLAAFAPRYDFGVNVMRPRPTGFIKDNAAGPDSSHDSDNELYLYIPQGGLSWTLSPAVRMGVTIQSAGIGPEYGNSPYQRFGGAKYSTLQLSSSAISTAISVDLDPQNSVGFALNLGYQIFKLEGVSFLEGFSQKPGQVSDNGSDGAFNVGFSLGWRAKYANGVSWGLGYKSKSWAQRHTKYAGALVDKGRLELPAIWGAGLSYQLTESLLVAADYQRFEFEAEPALANRLGALQQGNAFGSANGPGLGYQDLNAYKLGVKWQVLPKTQLMLGYIDANQMMNKSEMLFGMLAPVTATTHYTIGFVTSVAGFEVSGVVANSPKKTVRGKNSIPAEFGGGDADVSYEMWSFGLSIGQEW